jgi:hypothetical protein
MPTKNVLVLTIPAGQSLSNSVDLTTLAVAMITAPPDWTDANISFQVSDDNASFYDLFDAQGIQILRTFKAGRAVIVDPTMTQAALYARVRSGSAENPIEQEADRILKFICI